MTYFVGIFLLYLPFFILAFVCYRANATEDRLHIESANSILIFTYLLNNCKLVLLNHWVDTPAGGPAVL